MLAIVIPYFKKFFFEDTLDSLANQTKKDFTVYIGNDASPEDPIEIIKRYRGKLNIVYKFFGENVGQTSLTKQWERCIKMIGDEEWIMILGDDDVLGKEVIEEFIGQQEEIRASKANVVRFATIEIDRNGKEISEKFVHPKLQDYSDVFFDRFFTGSRSSLSEYIFSRKQFEKFGFRDLPYAWHADDLAWLEFSEFGRIYTVNQSTVYFRLSQLNISRDGYLLREKKEIRYLFFTIVISEYLKKFKSNHIPSILLHYELMTYGLGKGNLKFWSTFLPLVLKYCGGWESIKFTRRVYLNHGRKRKEGIHHYSTL